MFKKILRSPAALSILFLLATFSWNEGDAQTKDMNGMVHCYFFLKGTGQPAHPVEVIFEGIIFKTNSNGAVAFHLPHGKQELLIIKDGVEMAKVAVPIVRNEITEVIITLSHDGSKPEIVLEAPAYFEESESATIDTSAAKGFLTGTVVDIEEKKPVVGARIFFRGVDAETKTDDRGDFSIELTAGTYALSIIHTQFATQTIEGIIVPEKESTSLQIEMTPTSFELDTYTVTAIRIEGGISSLMEERRTSTNVTDIIGAEQISKSGDSDAASALKRVTGLTVVGGKYVYVRGMGERYSSSLLNDAHIPSPEPERRVVPLDLFPVDVIESMEIQKTYSPDMPGEFGGGSVKIRTKGIPSGYIFSFSLSNGYNDITTGKQGYTYSGGSTDWLGFDDGTRSLPSGIDHSEYQIRKGTPNSKGYTEEEIEVFGESFDNTWEVNEFSIPTDFGLSTTVGNKHSHGENNFGYLLSLTYSSDYSKQERLYNNYGVQSGVLNLNDSYNFHVTTREIDLGGILDLGYSIGENHTFKLTTLLLRITEDRGRVYDGFAGDQGDYIRVTSLRWIEQMLLTEQLSGQHHLPGFFDADLHWIFTYSMASRDEPDRRDVKYELDDSSGLYRLSTLSDGNHRIFSELDGDTIDFALMYRQPYKVWNGLLASFSTGFNFMVKDRVVDTRRFSFNRGSDFPYEDLQLSPEEIFSADNIGPGLMELQESTLPTDHYEASQTMLAYYLKTDLPLTENFDFSGGFRVEYSEQVVDTLNIYSTSDEKIQAKLETTDVLPALTLTWRFYPDMQLRGGFSQTVSRPDFRELSPATYNDVVGGREIKGNPEVQRALINNYDIRWEWYPTATESISVGAFYKKFIDPIESTIDGGSNQQMSFENADGAENYGIEFEFRKSMGFIMDSLDDLYFSGNFAFIESDVQLGEGGGDVTSKNRALQGQSPYVINLSLNYDNPESKRNIALLYNTFGKRISNVGYSGLPDVYEQPFQRLDFVVGTGIFGRLGVKFKIKNLLDEKVEYTQENEITETYETGRSYSLSFSLSY